MSYDNCVVKGCIHAAQYCATHVAEETTRYRTENERLRAYLNAIADGAHEGASHTWLRSMAAGALRGDHILIGEAGNWRELRSGNAGTAES
jgi:hypothetical protein